MSELRGPCRTSLSAVVLVVKPLRFSGAAETIVGRSGWIRSAMNVRHRPHPKVSLPAQRKSFESSQRLDHPSTMATHTPSQRYLSTRGGSYGFSFEDVVLKGLAQDGGLFIPEEIPSLPADWQTGWRDASFQELAFNIFSLYITPSEIPPEDLRQIINKSYATFRVDNITPNVTLDTKRNIHLLELFHGPVSSLKDLGSRPFLTVADICLQRCCPTISRKPVRILSRTTEQVQTSWRKGTSHCNWRYVRRHWKCSYLWSQRQERRLGLHYAS